MPVHVIVTLVVGIAFLLIHTYNLNSNMNMYLLGIHWDISGHGDIMIIYTNINY